MKEQMFHQPHQPENFKPDNEVYEKATLIVQTTNGCSKNCPACYLAQNSKIEKEELEKNRYEECVLRLKEGETIALRGGEITIVPDWFEKFVVPALDKGLKIIIETNGYFIGKQDYQDILEKITNDQIFIRISFDLEHIKNLSEQAISSEFEKMTQFAKDAENAGINFGFYSLGMDKSQIQNFVQGTPLESYAEKFHSLQFYPEISAVDIKGQYLKSNGNLSDKIEV